MSTSNQGQIKDTEGYRNSIATIDDKGHRSWIFPKKPKGRFYKRRTLVSWLLLAFFFMTPFIKIDGNPFLMLNIFDRKFIIFGALFPVQDFYLLVLAMLTSLVFLILFTVIYGRVFCGWVCPQTIFLEMVYRKIEYIIEGTAKAQRKLKMAPWTANKIFKRLLKHAIFIAIALLVINTFISYLIGIDGLLQKMSEPISMNTGAFSAMLLFSAAFYFVFSWFREQVCIVACPYGRLQGVMLDKNSIVVAYDEKRGEPRGKKSKKKKVPKDSIAAAVAAGDTLILEEGNAQGDCIDCTLCVQVCPTGIDIRHGTQLECVNCTACIDACDEVMDKIDRPRGLIRFDSLAGMEEGRKSIFTTRVKAYSAVLILMVIGLSSLFLGRSDADLLVLKARGTLYNNVGETDIENLYNYEITNKTNKPLQVEMKLVGEVGRIEFVDGEPGIMENSSRKGVFFIIVDKSKIKERKTTFYIDLFSNGRFIDRAETTFFGPLK